MLLDVMWFVSDMSSSTYKKQVCDIHIHVHRAERLALKRTRHPNLVTDSVYLPVYLSTTLQQQEWRRQSVYGAQTSSTPQYLDS